MDLALFPLQTVLFPGMKLPLHIFEERYKLMVRECIDDEMRYRKIIGNEPEAAGSRPEPK